MSTEEQQNNGLRSRKELAEELARARSASMDKFRNDEGTVFDDNYYAFWQRYKQLESDANKIGLTWWEVEEARKRLERGIPVGIYGEDNIFLPYVERLTNILNSHRYHLGAAEKCVKKWANCFRYSIDVPINDRVQMMWNCRGIIMRWRKEVSSFSFYPLFKTVLDALGNALIDGDQVELTKVRDIFDLFEFRRGRDLELEYFLERLAKSQGTTLLHGQNLEEIKEALSKAENLRTIDACEEVRFAIDKSIPGGSADLPNKVQIAQQFVEPAQRLIRLALDCGDDCYYRGDIDNAQKLWVLGLSTSDMLRFHWTGRLELLVNRVGKPVRHRWPRLDAEPFIYREDRKKSTGISKLAKERRQCRKVSSELFSKWLYWQARDVGQIIGSDNGFTGPTTMPSFEKFIVLSYHIMDDDLVVFLHNQIDHFMYGDDFRDYAYTSDKILPSSLLCAPLIKHNVRQEIIRAIHRLHSLASEQADVNPGFSETLNLLSELLAIHDVDANIVRHCINTNMRREDIRILIVPDGPLHRIPFCFLRASNGEPLYQRYAAISTSFSLMSLKWQLMSYLWRCLPFLPDYSPRCVFVGVSSTTVDTNLPFLSGVLEEWNSFRTIFGNENLLAFGDAQSDSVRATLDNIATYHRDAEIFWYSGHGLEESESQLTVGGLELPRMGLVLPDEVLTSDFFYRGEPWNFHSSWMVVLNTCLLGRLYERGTEMMGFLSALYLVGATSVVTCLWHVDDGLAVEFAREFSKRLIQSYAYKDRREKEFVKATAFTETLRKLVRHYSEVKVACYFYSGVP